jgi:hypothetical protein
VSERRHCITEPHRQRPQLVSSIGLKMGAQDEDQVATSLSDAPEDPSDHPSSSEGVRNATDDPGEGIPDNVPAATAHPLHRLKKALKSCLKKRQCINPPKKVIFADTLATDLTSGDSVAQTSVSGQEYRHRWATRHGRGQKRLWRNRRRRMWRGALNRVTSLWRAEARARRIGGERRATWQRILLQYLRKNGLNGQVDGRSSRRESRR